MKKTPYVLHLLNKKTRLIDTKISISLVFYKNSLNTIKNITPGTPKHPAIKAVIQLIPK